AGKPPAPQAGAARPGSVRHCDPGTRQRIIRPLTRMRCASARPRSSSDQVLDDAGQVGAGLGEAVEVILALAPRRDDAAVAEQGEMMADGRLTLAELGAQGADVPLPLGEDQDDLEPGGVADVLEQDRGAACLVIPLLGPADGLGPSPDRLGGRRSLGAGLRRCWHGIGLLSLKKKPGIVVSSDASAPDLAGSTSGSRARASAPP